MGSKEISNLQNNFFELSQDLICVTNFHGSFKYINPIWEKLLGYSEEELRSNSFLELTHPDDQNRTNEEFSHLSKEKTTINFENRYICKDDSIKYIHWKATPQTDKELIYCIGRDITESKKIQESLKKDEVKYHSLLHTTNEAIFIVQEGVFKFANKKMSALLGVPVNKLIDKPYIDFVWPEDRELILTNHQRRITDEELPNSYDIRIIGAEGKMKWILLSATKIQLEGKPATINLFTDITKRKRSEDALKSSEQKYKSLIYSSPMGMNFYRLEKNNRLILDGANPSADLLLGISHNDLIGKTIEDAFPNLVQTEIPEIYRKVAKGELGHQSFEIPYQDKRFSGFFKVDVFSNQPSTIAVHFTDISAIKNAELELIKATENAEKTNAIITAIIEGNKNSTWAFNRNYEILYINHTFQDEFLQLYGALIKPGVNLIEVIPETVKGVWKSCYDRVLANEQFSIEDSSTSENGTKYIQISFNPIVKNGQVIGGACKASNITNRKLAELELIKAKEKAEESDRLKSAFLANMSHEIRTPLNGILGFTELLVDTSFDTKQKDEMGKIILENGELLLTIINDVLDISKIEAGQIVITKSTFKISNLIKEVTNSFRVKAQNKNLDLKIDPDDIAYHSTITSDFIRLKQILSNLVSNSLKYTETGFVEIGCKRSRNDLIFCVADSGIGIDKKHHKKIFERFNREEAYTKKAGGNGLGLAISKSFVEMLGGKIGVESEKGKGSKFYFTIPLN